MKKQYLLLLNIRIITIILIFCFLPFLSNGQASILISTGGTVNVNNGDNFYDAGGSTGNDNNTTYVITLTPAIPGEKVALDFTYFNTYYSGNNLGDYVEIFDGTTVTANQLAQITGDFNTSPASNGLRVNATGGIPAVTSPGVFSASNASGALTIRFKNNYATTAPGFSATIKTYKTLGNPGCNISLTASSSSVCPGQSVALTATGNIVTTPLSNNFNSGAIGTGWSSTVSASFANPTCAVTGFDGVAHASTFLWMSNVAFPRSLASIGLNVVNGGTISFDYRQAIQAGASPCEGPDINGSGSTAEGVYLQYSTNSGLTWTTFNYLFPRDDNQNSFGGYYPGTGRYVESWRNIIVPIPAAAATTNTMFRLHQQIGTGNTYDNWGLDNILVSSPVVSTITITNLATGAVVGNSTTSPFIVNVSPITTTTYRATITDGTTSCFHDFTVNVGLPNATISYPSSPYLNTISTSQPITLIGTTGGTYTATPTGLSINAATGAIIPSTSSIGIYTVKYSIAASGPCPAFSTTTTVEITGPSCGSCSSPTCPIGVSSNYSNAYNDHLNNCNTGIGLVGPATYTSYHTVVVGSSGVLGVVASANFFGSGSCPANRTFKLYPVGSCGIALSAISPSIANANGSPVSNPEWSGLIPGATYILVVTHVVTTGCQMNDICQSYYSPNPPVTCNTCANPSCPVSSMTTSTAALGQTGITTTMASAGNQLNISLFPGDTAKICVPVTVPAGSTILGFKQRGTGSPGGCTSPTEEIMTYELKPATACNSSAILPNVTNASSVASGFNPQWNNLTPGNYVLCFKIEVSNFALCSLYDLQNLGYYNVIPPCSNPVITTEPVVTQTKCQNSAPTNIFVIATGTNLTYQWFSNTSNTNVGGTLISGATASSYTPSTSTVGTTYYYCIVYSAACSTKTIVSKITVNPNVTPTFTQVAAICSGGSLSALPTTSINGITGSWSPSLNTTTTTTYTFTPTAGLCATTATMTITVNPNVTPTFTQVAAICSGGNLSALPTTSTNGITGSWSPSLNTTTTTYTFTPTAGLCATTATMTITVNPNVTPTFTQVAAICSGGSLSALPTTSTNGITGSWSPSLNTTTTTTYTFTPTAGLCATTATMIITVNPNVTPTFTQVAAICSGGSLSALPTTSTNGITGSWSPSLNTTTTTYTFTPTAGLCATTATMTITVNTNVTPTFTQVAAICSGGSLSALPTTSTNGITGSWSPSLNTTTTTTYTFTPTAGLCATTATMIITVNPNVTPTFTQVAAICSGGSLSALPTTSTNGITGSWSPSLNTTTTTTYTFTPTAGLCATTATMTITVNPNVTPTFTQVAAICSGGSLSALPTTSTNGITGSWSPSLNTTTTTTYTFTPTAGLCATTATMIITVNPKVTPIINCGTSTVTSVSFNWTALTGATGYTVTYQINSNTPVNVGSIGNLTSYQVSGLNANDNVQITVTPVGGLGTCFLSSSLNCSATACVQPTASISYVTPVCNNITLIQGVTLVGTGNYTGGTYSSLGLIIDSITGGVQPSINAAGTYTVNYTLVGTAGCPNTVASTSIEILPVVVPTFTQVAAICSGGSLSALPTTSTNGITGSWSPSLNTTTTTTYTFTPTAGLCAITATMTITVNPNVTPTFTQVAAICSGGSLSALPTTSTNGITGSWSPSLNTTTTTTYTFTPTAGLCATTATMTITVNPNVTPTFTQVAAICSGGSLSALPTTSTNGITGSWSPSLNTTTTTTYTFTPTAGLCATTATMTITVGNPIKINNIDIIQPSCLGTSLGAINISAFGGFGVLNYTLGTALQTSSTFTGLTAGNYTITIVDAIGCTATSTATIFQPIPINIIQVNLSVTSCDDKSNLEIIVSGGTQPITYSINTIGLTNNTGYFVGLNPGSYIINVADANGCTDKILYNLSKPTPLKTTLQFVSNGSCLKENIGNILCTTLGGVAPYKYTLNPGNLNSNNGDFYNLNRGEYVITTIDSNGCTTNNSITIKGTPCCDELFIPNAFTPNNDNNNDEFTFLNALETDIELIDFVIVNRFGNVVFKANHFYDKWDGKYKGVSCDIGTYFYMLRYKCYTSGEIMIRKGDINLLR